MKSMPDIIYMLLSFVTLVQYMYGNLGVLLSDLKILQEIGHGRHDAEMNAPWELLTADLEVTWMEAPAHNEGQVMWMSRAVEMAVVTEGCGDRNLVVDSEVVSLVQDAIASAPWRRGTKRAREERASRSGRPPRRRRAPPPHMPAKVPHGSHKRRRRLIARRRSIPERAQEINTVAPHHRQRSYADRSSMTARVRGMLKGRPPRELGSGLSNREGRFLEVMLRQGGARGAFRVIAGFLRMVATILIDAATLLEIVEYDLPDNTAAIGEVPSPVAPPSDETLVEVEEDLLHEGEEVGITEADEGDCLDVHAEEIALEYLEEGHLADEVALEGDDGRNLNNEGEQDEMESEQEDFALVQKGRGLVATGLNHAADSVVAAIKWLSLHRRGVLRGLQQQAVRAKKSKLRMLQLLGIGWSSG